MMRAFRFSQRWTVVVVMMMMLAVGPWMMAAANEPKRIELFPQATHDDLFDQGAWEKTQAFVDSVVGAR